MWKEQGFRNPSGWDYTLALPLTSCVNSGKPLNCQDCSFSNLQKRVNNSTVEIPFFAQEAASTWGPTPSNWNLDNFCVLIIAVLNQKHRLASQPIPNAKPVLALLTTNRFCYVAPASQIFSNCLFHVLCTLSYRSFLPSTPFCSSPKGDCLDHPKLFSLIIFK